MRFLKQRVVFVFNFVVVVAIVIACLFTTLFFMKAVQRPAAEVVDIGADAASNQIIYSNNFDQHSVGSYSTSLLKQDWGNVKWEDGVSEGRTSIVSDNAYLGKSLQVKYPQGWATSGDGAKWPYQLPASQNEVYFSYHVRFGDKIDFVKGGKLPGIGGGNANTGGEKPTCKDGWSNRVMWRPDGRVVAYVYHCDQPGTYGQDFQFVCGNQNCTFKPGQWHQITGYTKLNTPGQKDGVVRYWLDGELVLDKKDLRFRDVSGLEISQVLFETFFGGSDSTWGPKKDEFISFDDFQISTANPLPDSGSTSQPSSTPNPVASPAPTKAPLPSPLTATPMPSTLPVSNALVLSGKMTSDWKKGFCYEVTVKNSGKTTATYQLISFTMADADIYTTWNGKFIKSGNHYTGVPSKKELKGGKTAKIGWCANKKGTNYVPSGFQIK